MLWSFLLIFCCNGNRFDSLKISCLVFCCKLPFLTLFDLYLLKSTEWIRRGCTRSLILPSSSSLRSISSISSDGTMRIALTSQRPPAQPATISLKD